MIYFTAFATNWPRRVTQILRLEEAKKNRLTRFPTFRASRTYNIPVPGTPCPPNTTNSYAKEGPSFLSIPSRETRVPKPNRQIPRSLTTAEKTTESGENFSLALATPKKNSSGSKEQTDSYLSECGAFFTPPSRATRPEQRAKHQPGYPISPSARRSTLPPVQCLGKSLSKSPSKRKARSSVHNPLSPKRIRYSKKTFSPRQDQHNAHEQTLSPNLPSTNSTSNSPKTNKRKRQLLPRNAKAPAQISAANPTYRKGRQGKQ